MKLLGNMFLMFLTSGFADMLSLAKALEVAPDEAAALFGYSNPGATVGGTHGADDERPVLGALVGARHGPARTRG